MTLSAMPRAKAPELPPSPIIVEIVGTVREEISANVDAIARPKPLSSASYERFAPGVSTKLITGNSNFSAILRAR